MWLVLNSKVCQRYVWKAMELIISPLHTLCTWDDMCRVQMGARSPLLRIYNVCCIRWGKLIDHQLCEKKWGNLFVSEELELLSSFHQLFTHFCLAWYYCGRVIMDPGSCAHYICFDRLHQQDLNYRPPFFFITCINSSTLSPFILVCAVAGLLWLLSHIIIPFLVKLMVKGNAIHPPTLFHCHSY